MNVLAIVLALAVPQQGDADKAAAELLQKLEDKVMRAKTLHIEFEAGPKDKEEEAKLKGTVKIGDAGGFFLKIVVTQRKGEVEEVTFRSDGKLFQASGGPGRLDTSKWKAADVEKALRRSSTEANFLVLMLMWGGIKDPAALFNQLKPGDVKSEGTEKLEGVDASVVSFRVEPEFDPKPPGQLTVKVWIDPLKLRLLKSEVAIDRENILETPTRFDLDAPFAADEFEFQTAALLKEGRALQVARSVMLHARFTGRVPRTLEDLTRRPDDLPASVFWPAGGFWIGGPLPKDLEYSRDATHFTVGSIKEPIPPASPVSAPSDRLKKFFEARVRIHLLKAAVEGYHKATSTLPTQIQDLHTQPDTLRFWPEGGWVRADALSADPWGEKYEIKTGASFTAAVKNRRARQVKMGELTAEEKKGLDEASFPALSQKDAAEVAALMGKLGSERLADREEASRSIAAKGTGALKLVNARLENEKDPEVRSRLNLIQDQLRSVRPTWERELKMLSVDFTPGKSAGRASANERNISWSLKTLTTAQADFRANDRDGNREMDFWVKDVAGLYGLEFAPDGGEAAPGKDATRILKLIEPSLAGADATEGRLVYPTLDETPQPKAGYLVASLKNFVESGKAKPYDTGKGRNPDRFGFVAYPAEHGVGGRRTFIVNEDNVVWSKDLEGEEIDTFPANPASDGWVQVD